MLSIRRFLSESRSFADMLCFVAYLYRKVPKYKLKKNIPPLWENNK